MEITDLTLPAEPFTLCPVADVQLGAAGCDETRFKEYINEGIERNAWFVSLGDLVDVASPSNRERLRFARLYDSVQQALEEKAQEHIERFLRLVRGTEGKWLGFLEGHHFYDFEDGSTSDTRIAKALRGPFLEKSAYSLVKFKSGHHVQTLSIHASHGEGSAEPLPKLKRNVVPFHPNVDLYLTAHTHKLKFEYIDTLSPTRKGKPRLVGNRKVLAAVGSYMRGYLEGGKATYVEANGLPPVALGGMFIKVRPYTNSDGLDRLDIRVEM